jgi:hypothetical protein
VDTGAAKHEASNQSMLDWLEEVARWKAGLKVRATPGVSAADLIIEDRHARR